MKLKLNHIVTTTAATAALALFANCTVEKEEDGEMPSVDVEVDGGKLPKYDVDAPDVDVEMKKVEVEVPTIDFDSAAEDEKEDGTD